MCALEPVTSATSNLHSTRILPLLGCACLGGRACRHHTAHRAGPLSPMLLTLGDWPFAMPCLCHSMKLVQTQGGTVHLACGKALQMPREAHQGCARKRGDAEGGEKSLGGGYFRSCFLSLRIASSSATASRSLGRPAARLTRIKLSRSRQRQRTPNISTFSLLPSRSW